MSFSLFNKSGNQQYSDSQESEYWLSFSDLMAGLLMIFALMLLVSLIRQNRLECERMIYQGRSQELQEVIESRQKIIQELQGEFNTGTQIAVDSLGTVRFAGSLLFDQGSAQISRTGRIQLSSFSRNYFPLLLDNSSFRSQLKSITVEGHTNDDGSYEYNLDLSHKRSLSVMLVLLQSAGKHAEDLKKLVTANGRSFADLVYHDDGRIDKSGSRRIEIQFQMDDQALTSRALGLNITDIASECY